MNRTLSALLAVAFLAGTASVADAQAARQARHEVEASMLVTGHVDIDRDGTVTGHVLDQPEKLPSYVVDLVERSASGMRFDPILVDGVPALARAKMRLRLIATPSEGGTMNVRIASAHFGDENDADDPGRIRADSMLPPRYPVDVARMGGTGVVYLLLKINRDGLPEDVVAEQVNLTALGTARQMESIRSSLAKSAIAGAKRWRFVPPTEGDEAARDYWVVRTPVSYFLQGQREPAYGQWAAYHPGRANHPDWAAPTPAGFSPDTLMAGEVAPESSRFKLLTPIEG